MASNIRSILGIGSLPGTILSDYKTSYTTAGTRELDLSTYNNYSNFLFIASAGAHGSNIGGTGFGLWIINNLTINQLITYSGQNGAGVSLSISGSIISVGFRGGRTSSISYNLFGL